MQLDWITAEEVARRCSADGEFRLAARYWDGGLRLRIGAREVAVTVTAGQIDVGDPGSGPGVLGLAADEAVWVELVRAVPAPGYQDIVPAERLGLRRTGDELVAWQYLPALQRLVELLRPPLPELPPTHDAPAEHAPTSRAARRPPRVERATGRYVHLDLGGQDHRIYVEEAGTGIPMLLQHTAGSHGVQWRHLMEEPTVTERFRLIAYDLPFHGKSVPPVGPQWWAQPYRLEGAHLRSIPVGLAEALELERPVFMGCSVGGLLALDLALHHPDVFRAVISLEGALRVGGDLDALVGFWHPAVSGESKARMMEGLISPTSPQAYRKETAQTYAAGWPPAFLGDLAYYCVEFDLRDRAHLIDTSRVGVHILTGEYDYSATPAHGRRAHEAIAGSTFSEMAGLGHFPMSEDPERFLLHLLPVLDGIARPGAPAATATTG